ncbi:fasciclin domain-containing protein [Sphingobacterium daejeonense]|uniref:fasciclin domain-containing protein n=1 Tax=Sphingobacterium daejeonense TaxID=371142 RepID=UPI003D3194FD
MKTRQYLYAILLIVTASSCAKDEPIPEETQKNTLTDVVRDNFGLTYLLTALHKSGLNKTLMETGPYTLIAPSDDAYNIAGYQNPAALYAEPAGKLAEQGQYHILKTQVTFAEKDLKMNQEEETLLGTKIYWSRVKRGQDTLTTINGGRLLQSDTKAANGVMQVLDRVLAPNIHENLKRAIGADADLSLFYEALKVSGLLESLAGSTNLTVFAPNNTAVKNYGYANLEAIEKADPEVLKAWLSYHIAKDRKFAQDYFLLTPEGTTTYTEEMSNGKTITIDLLSEYNVPNSFTGINMQGSGNPSGFSPLKTDRVTGNGVIHIIGEVLR